MSYKKIFEITHLKKRIFEKRKEEEITSNNKLFQIKKDSKVHFFVSKKPNDICLNKKRGRPSLTIKKNPKLNQNKYKIDNIKIKIKSHFHSFIIGFFNDLIKLKFKIQRYKFRKIPYHITKDVTFKTNLSLKNQTICDLLSNDISNKYKKYESGKNRKSLYYFNKTLKYEEQNNSLSKTYKDFFMIFI